MVNKRDVEVFIVCLSCHFDMRKLPYPWCGDPGLPIRNTRYAYNSWSHDQCVVNPHIRVDNRITSSITLTNNKLTTGHMTKLDNATQGKFTTKQRIPNSIGDPHHAYYPTGNWLGDVPSLHQHRRTPHHHPHNLTKLIARDKAVSTFWNCTCKPSKRKFWHAVCL
jgi:hypothetical protein